MKRAPNKRSPSGFPGDFGLHRARAYVVKGPTTLRSLRGGRHAPPCATMRRGAAAKLGYEGLDAVLEKLRASWGDERFLRFKRRNSLASSQGDEAFIAQAEKWRDTLGDEKFYTFMSRNSLTKRLGDRAFNDQLEKWNRILGGNKSLVTFMCDGVAKRLGEKAFDDELEKWRRILGKEGFVTFMCSGVAARLGEKAFDAFLVSAFELLDMAKLVAIMSGGMVSRYKILGDFLTFYATCPRWTSRMSRELCKIVPLSQTAPVTKEQWEAAQVAAHASSKKARATLTKKAPREKSGNNQTRRTTTMRHNRYVGGT